MDLTPEIVAPFIGGQLEIQNMQEGYFYRGEIEKIEFSGFTMKVTFKWLGKLGLDGWMVAPVEKWVYEADLPFTTVDRQGKRLIYEYIAVGELGTFFPPGDSRLDPKNVQGLNIS